MRNACSYRTVAIGEGTPVFWGQACGMIYTRKVSGEQLTALYASQKEPQFNLIYGQGVKFL
jgi:hypothetical protein